MKKQLASCNPSLIPGRWREGYALDVQTRSSTYLGDDSCGNPIFENTRSELGEMLYQLKYNNDQSQVEKIADVAAGFIQKWKPNVDVMVPVPPSRARKVQPVLALGRAISSRLALGFSETTVKKVRAIPELKGVHDFDMRMELLKGIFECKSRPVRGHCVLLFDDLFRSGATMNAVAASLFDQGGVRELYCLAITRTRVLR